MDSELEMTCPVCTSQFTEPYRSAFSSMKDKPVTVAVTYYDICLECGIIFQNPMLENELEFYRSGDYRNSLLMDTTQENLDTHEEQDAQRYIDGMNLNPKSILDIGCSRGYFLKKAKEKFGCRTVGVEPNLGYVTEKPDALYTYIHDVDENEHFDVITAFHVLEHVRKPNMYVTGLLGMLNKEGHLIIEVPSEASQGSPYRPAHLYMIQPWVIAHWLKPYPVAIYHTPHTLVVCRKHL